MLGRFIPDFGKVVAMMQFNMYHHYTVDEHLLRSIGELADIDRGSGGDEHPLVNEIMPLDPEPQGALCRDVPARHRQGPAGGPFHRRRQDRPAALPALRAQRGRDRHGRLAGREPSRDVDDGAVARHLRPQDDRDLRRHGAVPRAAEAAPHPHRRGHPRRRARRVERLEGPACCARSSGRRRWCSPAAIRASSAAPACASRRTNCAPDLPDWGAEALDAYIARHYAPYWLKVDLERKIRHARFVRAVLGRGESLGTEVATDAFRGVTELTILAPDHPRLLADHHRRLRRGRRQHRRRPDQHDQRRAGPRHDLRRPRVSPGLRTSCAARRASPRPWSAPCKGEIRLPEVVANRSAARPAHQGLPGRAGRRGRQ